MPRPASLSPALTAAALAGLLTVVLVVVLAGPTGADLSAAASPTAPAPTAPAPTATTPAATTPGEPTGTAETPEPGEPTTEPEPAEPEPDDPDPEDPDAAAAEPDPLQISIRDVSPATLPQRGPIRITGSITNTSLDTWSEINVHPFMSESPMTTAEEIAVAAESDPRLFVGERILAPGSFEAVGELAPGESARFSLRVARTELPVGGSPAPGVYWFGVHALGSSPTGRDGTADGRARTFLPHVADDTASLEGALVLPVRRKLLHTPDGRVADDEGWAREVAEGGRLRRTVDFAATAGSTPLTWLVDPAVLKAVSSLAVGNPPRSLGEEPEEPEEEPAEEPTEEPSDETTGETTGGPDDDAPAADAPPAGEEGGEEGESSSVQRDGLVWLQRFSTAIAGHEVLGLPYGDLDSNAAAAYDLTMSRTARQQSRTAFEALDSPVLPAVAPPQGVLSSSALLGTNPDDVVMVSDRMLPADLPATSRAQVSGRDLVVTTSAAAAGGPGPDSRTAPTAMRQRILAEGAVRLLADDPAPLVVALPERWRPRGGGARFFRGLDQAWLRMVSVSNISSGPVPALGIEELLTDVTVGRRSLTSGNFTAVNELIDAGATLQRLLADDGGVGEQIAAEALSTTSYHNARTPEAARLSATAATRWVRDRLSQVTVQAPPYVTLSSASGRFSVSLVNNLEHRVTVRLRTGDDGPVSIDVPETIELEPGTTTSLLVTASARRIGTHNVDFEVTDVDGNPLGSSVEVPIRSAQVSNIIWFVIAGGALMLLVAVVVRVWRRLRGRGPDESDESDEPAETDETDAPAGPDGLSGETGEPSGRVP